MRTFNLIYARTSEFGIGKDNKIPWNDSGDLKHFKKVTINNIVIMGKKTRESIGRELPDRINRIITKYNTLEFVLSNLYGDEYKDKEIFIIGGGYLYNYCIDNYYHLINKVYRTIILDNKYECDVFIKQFPIDTDFKVIENLVTSKGNPISISHKINFEENQYLSLLKEILTSGNKKNDRTKVGTLSLFSKNLTFNLSNGLLPLFTTKHVSFKNVLTELLWFIKGSCNLDFLHQHGCKIWDANVKEKGQLGPMYPMQWRRRGAMYMHDDVDSKEGSTDQLANMIKLIREDPDSRRILIDNWDVVNLDKMCLNPCHVLFQLYVNGDMLEGSLYLRSSDAILGLPYNTASYAILLHMLAHVTNKKAVKLHVTMGDTHIYNTHIEAAKEQIQRLPRTFPTIKIDSSSRDIDSLEHSHFKLCDYNHCGKLNSPTPMAV